MMTKIYTKTRDKKITLLYGDSRVSKNHLRVCRSLCCVRRVERLDRILPGPGYPREMENRIDRNPRSYFVLGYELVTPADDD